MKLRLDQGLPRTAAAMLHEGGLDAIHTGECGMARASDAEILDRADKEDGVVVTLDADFHALLALSEAAHPSVIRARIEGLRAAAMRDLLLLLLRDFGDDLEKGCVLSVTQTNVRMRALPIRSSR